MKFITENFDSDEHKFLIMATKDQVITHTPRLMAFTRNSYYLPKSKRKIWDVRSLRQIFRLFDEAKHIIWHSLAGFQGKRLPVLYCRSKYLRKTVWIEHWFDLKYWESKKKGLFSSIRNYCNYKIRKDIECVGLTMVSDELFYRNSFSQNVQCVETPMPIPKNRLKIMKRVNEEFTIEKHHPIILVGYGASEEYKHCECIDRLVNFKEEIFSLVFFMNLGITWEYRAFAGEYYRKRVEQYAEKTLGRKPVIIKRKNTPEEAYFQIIKSIDIAVFDGERPITFDLLLYLLYMGKKVFLPSEQPLYKYLIANGVKVFDTNTLQNISYSELMKQPEFTDEEMNWIEGRLNHDLLLGRWKSFFNTLDNQE